MAIPDLTMLPPFTRKYHECVSFVAVTSTTAAAPVTENSGS